MTCRCAPNARCGRCFSEAEYASDAAAVVAHAVSTGKAIVVRDDGSPRVVISIPPAEVDCPTCKGYGRITVTGLHSRTCPACAGSGEV